MLDWGKVNPALLRKAFKADVEAFLQSSPYRWEVRYGFRSLEEQAALYKTYQAGGPRAAPAGRSAHNFGLAVDVVLDGSDQAGTQADWDTSHPGWTWLTVECKRHPRLHSGASYADYGHLEAVDWIAQSKHPDV